MPNAIYTPPAPYRHPWFKWALLRLICVLMRHKETIGYSIDGKVKMCFRCSWVGRKLAQKRCRT